MGPPVRSNERAPSGVGWPPCSRVRRSRHRGTAPGSLAQVSGLPSASGGRPDWSGATPLPRRDPRRRRRNCRYSTSTSWRVSAPRSRQRLPASSIWLAPPTSAAATVRDKYPRATRESSPFPERRGAVDSVRSDDVATKDQSLTDLFEPVRQRTTQCAPGSPSIVVYCGKVEDLAVRVEEAHLTVFRCGLGEPAGEGLQAALGHERRRGR